MTAAAADQALAQEEQRFVTADEAELAVEAVGEHHDVPGIGDLLAIGDEGGHVGVERLVGRAAADGAPGSVSNYVGRFCVGDGCDPFSELGLTPFSNPRTRELNCALPGSHFHMALTLDQIVEEAQQWPDDVVAELVDRLMLARHGVANPSLSPAWRPVVARRVEEIRSGKVQGIPGEVVSARIRKIVGR